MSGGTKLCLVMLMLPATAASGQTLLDQFSYEGVRLSGIGVEIGPVLSDRVTTEVSVGVRIDYGLIAPRVRLALGGNYFNGEINDAELAKFEANLQRVVIDPTGDATVDVGPITWANLETNLDLHYLLPVSPRYLGYVGLGFGVHFRNGSGSLIDDTFVEDALDTVAAGATVSVGLEAAVAGRVNATVDVRGVATSEMRLFSVRAGLTYRLRPWALQ